MRIVLEIEVERYEGRFCSREDIEQALCDEIGSISLDVNDSTYEVSSVGSAMPPKKPTVKKQATPLADRSER